MKKCKYCGEEYPDEATSCGLDGSPLEIVSPRSHPPELPLHLLRRPVPFAQPQNWLTLSKEGLRYYDGHSSLFFRWNDVAGLALRGHRTRSGIFSRTSWHNLIITLNGFEASPILISLQGSERKPTEILDIIKSICNTFRNGRSVPALDQVFPKLAQALEHLPLKIGFPKADCVRGVVLGLIIFLLLFVAPIAALCLAGEHFAGIGLGLICLSPFAGIGLGIIIVHGLRWADRNAKLTLTEDGLTYHRGWKHLSIEGRQVFTLKPGVRKMMVVLRGQQGRASSVSLKLRGLDYSPRDIYVMIDHLCVFRWSQEKGSRPKL